MNRNVYKTQKGRWPV